MPCHRLGDCGRGSKWCRPLHPPLRPISPRARSKAAMSAHAKLRSSKESPNGGNHSYRARVDPKQEAVCRRRRAVQPCTNKSTSVRPPEPTTRRCADSRPFFDKPTRSCPWSTSALRQFIATATQFGRSHGTDKARPWIPIVSHRSVQIHLHQPN